MVLQPRGARATANAVAGRPSIVVVVARSRPVADLVDHRGVCQRRGVTEDATLGNIAQVSQVDDRLEVVTPEPEAQFYVVKKGDTLSKIAKEYYGDFKKYPVIFEANKPMLKDPDLIYPGQTLRIPPL